MKYLEIFLIYSAYFTIGVFSYSDKNATQNLSKKRNVQIRRPKSFELIPRKIHILEWTSKNPVLRNNSFLISSNCSFTNCFIHSDRKFLEDYTKFDVIVFGSNSNTCTDLPNHRSPHQQYVFMSPNQNDLCILDNFYNMTWTYNLDSDLRWGFIVIRDMTGKVIGPKMDMHWIEQRKMRPVTDKLQKILAGKYIAAIWYDSTCFTPSKREDYAWLLKEELKKYDLKLDIFGSCGSHNTRGEKYDKEKIRDHYYFNLVFEVDYKDDLVTTILLDAVNYNAIPIVYGGANYSRFLPEGSYLDANLLNPDHLARKMKNLIENFDEYVDYFKWTNHYTYHSTQDSPDTNEYCQMCELLNDKKKIMRNSSYPDFRRWWYSKYRYPKFKLPVKFTSTSRKTIWDQITEPFMKAVDWVKNKLRM